MSSEDTRDRPWAEAADHNRRLVDEFVARPKVAQRASEAQPATLVDRVSALESRFEGSRWWLDQLSRKSSDTNARLGKLASRGSQQIRDLRRSVNHIQSTRLNGIETRLVDLEDKKSHLVRYQIQHATRIKELENARVPIWMALIAWMAGGASMVLLHELWKVIR